MTHSLAPAVPVSAAWNNDRQAVQVPFLDLLGQVEEVREDVSSRWERLLRTARFVGGPDVEAFERAWALYCQAEHAVAVGNGTDALHLALRAAGVGHGDEVIVPAATFVATAEAVVLAGAVPRFADVDPDTLLLTTETVAPVLGPRTAAIIPVHLYGQMADMPALCSLARSAGILVVEDAAQAHGATWQGRRAGSFGDMACFSFYPGKNLGAFGDAGAVVTGDPGLARSLRVLRDHGRAAGSHYEHEAIGSNSRLDALQAVVLSAKLPHLDRWNAMRRSIMEHYEQAADTGLVRQVVIAEEAVSSYHLAVVRVDDRASVQQQLASMGVGTGIHYPTPCHLQPAYMHLSDGPLPVAEAAAMQVLSLPMFPHMAAAQVDRVCAALQSLRPRAVDDVVD